MFKKMNIKNKMVIETIVFFFTKGYHFFLLAEFNKLVHGNIKKNFNMINKQHQIKTASVLKS